MALLDSEGFGMSTTYSDYTNYQLWTTIGTLNGGPSFAAGGPLGDNYMAATSNNSSVRKPLAAGASAFFYGQRLALSGTNYIGFWDASVIEQFHLSFNGTTGVITALRGATTLGASAPGAMPIAGWQYVEVGAVISTTAGSVTVRVNGSVVLAVTGVNTQNSTASNIVQNVSWGYSAFGQSGSVAHVYFCDDTGPAPWNNFLGDVRVQTIRPISNDAVQFTPALATAATGTASTTTSNTAAANTVYYQKIFVGAAGGTLTQADMVLTTAYTGNAHVALYGFNTAGTLPSGAPLAISAAVANPAAGTVTFTFSGGPHLSGGTTYWLALQTDTASNWRQNTANPGSSECSQTQAYTSGFPTTPAPGGLGTILFYMDVMFLPTNFDVAALSPPVPATYYNADGNVGDQDTFNCAPMSASLTSVLGVHVKVIAAKSDSGARSVETVLKSGGTTVTGASTVLSISPLMQRLMCQTDPNTSAQWSQAAVDAANPGYKVSA